jgi:UDP-N-acetylmuramoylalanine--D-glutamate ligase
MNKKISNKALILGLGKTGCSILRRLHQIGNTDLAAFDNNPSPAAKLLVENFGCSWLTSAQLSKAIVESNQIFLSPGIPPNSIPTLSKYKNKIKNDISLFLESRPTTVVAITGTNGKSTVANMLFHIGKKLHKRVVLAGNIGHPVLDQSIDLQKDTVILELSSFQLTSIANMKSHTAIILNCTNDHLDYHLTMDKYQQAKMNIFTHCHAPVLMRQQAQLQPKTIPQTTLWISQDKHQNNDLKFIHKNNRSYLNYQEKEYALHNIPVHGQHQHLNAISAISLGLQLDWSLKEMLQALESYQPLPHRCNLIRHAKNIQWIDDSKATNLAATKASILSLATKPKQIIVLLGGILKPKESLETFIVSIQPHVADIITFGQSSTEWALALSKATQPYHVSKNLREATNLAHKLASSGQIILLSPGGASFDAFKNFEERGQKFQKWVQEISIRD